jgi:hypothetical protein
LAQCHGLVHGRGEVGRAVVVGLDEQDAGVGRDGGDHVEVEGDLPVPARVDGRVVGAAGLVDLAEASAGAGARRQAVLLAVDGQVGLGGGVVVGVDDGDGLP